MVVFQVSSRNVESAVPPMKKPRRIREEWSTIIRFYRALALSGLIFTLLLIIFAHSDIVFILLPVLLYLATAPIQGYNLYKGTPAYLLLTICLTFIYYGIIILGISFIQREIISHIIIISTTLAWTIMLGPIRSYAQKRIERGFNLRDREAARAIEAFTSTLREEIDLDQLRERFLNVIEQTMQPYAISLWVRASHDAQEQPGALEEVTLANDDAFIAYALHHPGTLEIDRLQLDSPILRDLKLRMADMLLPLTSQGELLGLLLLGPHLNGEPYTLEERTILDTLASQVAPALRVAHMVRAQKAQIRERERIEQELHTAQAIQRTFLPKDVPALPGWQISPYYQSAREVGGDFYDFLAFPDGRWGLVIGDVTGKGVPAALVMATVHTMLRTTIQGYSSPGEILGRVNNLLVAEIPPSVFVTCFFALLDPQSGHLLYANAGHEPPYRQYEGQVAELWATGMPLGLMPDMCYEEHETTLSPGESLLFYSDGLVEAHNPEREMFGFPRLSALLGTLPGGSALINFLLSELATFTGVTWEQEDDVTMVTLQRMPHLPQ